MFDSAAFKRDLRQLLDGYFDMLFDLAYKGSDLHITFNNHSDLEEFEAEMLNSNHRQITQFNSKYSRFMKSFKTNYNAKEAIYSINVPASSIKGSTDSIKSAIEQTVMSARS